MKRSHFAPIVKNLAVVAAGLLISTSAWAQSYLLTIDAHQFYPAGGYPSAVANQTLPSGYRQIAFQADSGRNVSGQLTIRCRGGREYRNVGLYGSVQNPCEYNQLVNFDLYLSSPLMAGSYDRLRVYGYGTMNPPPTYPPGGSGQFLAAIDFSRFYPAQGYMAVGSQNISGGYSLYRFISTDRNYVSGKLTIRCVGGSEYRNVAISPAGNGSIFTNPCGLNRNLNIDVYLSSPRVGPGTYGQIQIFGQR